MHALSSITKFIQYVTSCCVACEGQFKIKLLSSVAHLSGLRNVDTNVEQIELACSGILHKFEHFTS